MSLSENYKDRYINESIALINSYYKHTEYGKMNLLCEKIIKLKYSNNETSGWDKEKLWLYYLYADCLDHCGSLKKSLEIFLVVYDQGLAQMEDNMIDFIWDAKAQIFNIRYALLDVNGLLEEIDNFLMQNVAIIQRKHTALFEIAYLNSLNRRIMVTLLLDRYEEAIFYKKTYKELATKLKNNNHIAYYYIDYARGIYHINPQKALVYMKIAYNNFLDLPNEKRRLIDTKSELRYLECVIDHKDISLLEEISEEIHEKGYTHM